MKVEFANEIIGFGIVLEFPDCCGCCEHVHITYEGTWCEHPTAKAYVEEQAKKAGIGDDEIDNSQFCIPVIWIGKCPNFKRATTFIQED